MKVKHSVIFMITFMMMLSTWCMCSVSASAAKAKTPVCTKKQEIRTLRISNEDPIDSEYNGGYLCIGNLAAGAKVYSVKSSNSNIIAESMLKKHGFHAIHVYPKNGKVKSGTKSTITFKVKQNKKTYTLKSTVTFRFVSPFKTFKLGNKEYVNANRVQTSGLKERSFSNVRKIVVHYKATKKPTYYKKPEHWRGESEAPLYGVKTIVFE